MMPQQAIYTDKAECQDCYKCVRRCPVKAIRIKEHSAMVMGEECIYCGTCVNICPVGAKKVRNDQEKALRVIAENKTVIASLAPSWVSEFPEYSEKHFIAAIKNLGFTMVSETALGADEVSRQTNQLLSNTRNGVFISSACPTAVLWIKKHFPEQTEKITPLLSPMLTHAKMLREYYGAETKIIFIGPCIAKKVEADLHPELIECALSFNDLRDWIKRTPEISREKAEQEEHEFMPSKSTAGVLYPIDGGMIRSMQSENPESDLITMSFSGFEGLKKAISTLKQESFGQPVFLELLACDGGCINGPESRQQESTVKKRLCVESSRKGTQSQSKFTELNIMEKYYPETNPKPEFSEKDIKRALREVGKNCQLDELNCGGCGYNSCREFANALLADKAEPAMCVSYMRKMASKKANALLKAMPAGVIIVDSAMKIVECNQRFSELMGEQWYSVYENVGTLEGVSVSRFKEFSELFSTALHLDEALERQIRFEGKIIKISLFPIEPHRLVGGIFQDITLPVVKKEQIIKKTQEVINKHLTTVQQIACLLGENAAESEVLLNSIIEMYSVEKGEGK